MNPSMNRKIPIRIKVSATSIATLPKNGAMVQRLQTPATASLTRRKSPGVNLHMYRFVENGNEDEATQGKSMLAYCVQSSVEYDGHEGRIRNAGIKKGDPSFELMFAGISSLDSNRLAACIFLIRLIRDDHKVVWKYFSAHHYSRTYNHLDHSPTYEEMVGQKGESPEKDHLYERLVSNQRSLYHELDGDTSHGYLLTEFGYDNWSTPPKSVSDLSWGPPWGVVWTTVGTPIVPGYDSIKSKGIIMARAELIIAASHLAGYTEYMMMNVFYNKDNHNPALFATPGRGGGGDHLPVKFENYWSRASLFTALHAYALDSVYSIKADGPCLIKFRNIQYPDSVCYAAWKGSYNGSSIKGYALKTPAVNGKARKVSVSFTSPLGEESAVPLSKGILTITLTERPELYFVKERR
jgi:hypothetical protein